jgi:hypothetical protein
LAFRDDHDAALQRAAALERELAAARKELESRDRALDRVQDQLAQARADLEEAAEAEREAPATQARARLDALVDEGERLREERSVRQAEARRQRQEEERRDGERGERKRQLRSMLRAGDFLLSVPVIFVAVPLLLLFGKLLLRLTGTGWTLLSVPLLVAVGPISYAYAKLAWLRRWARSRPYELRGYPQLLRVKPRTRDGDPGREVMGRVFGARAADGHERLTLTLEFTGHPPADLDRILRAFDETLASDNRTSWSRSSPVTEEHSKSGMRMGNVDTNWEVHRWVRRLERTVLRDLHRVSPLDSVTVSLS